eukprot:5191888-Pyramimonas_sp.AAC.1
MSAAICSYWGDVFGPKQVLQGPAGQYLTRFGGNFDFSEILPPTISGTRARLGNLEDCAPGPDKLPCAAWRFAPQAAELLDEYL